MKYFGGKSRLARKIVARIPEHRTFVEPFAGAASVTLAKPPSPREVLADKRVDMMRLLRRVKSGVPIKVPRHSKRIFARIRRKAEAVRTPGETYRLQASSFGGHGSTFADGTGATTTAKLLNSRLDRYADRLKHTTILTQDYQTTIKRFDSPRTTFYLDPPYTEEKRMYTHYAGRPIPSVEAIKHTISAVPRKGSA